MLDLTPWIDKNGLIKPRKDWTDSGNGVFYTTFLFSLIKCTEYISPAKEFLHTEIAQRCFRYPGVLMRTPDNKYGLEQHDNYLGFSVGRLNLEGRIGYDWRCQRIMEHGFWNLYFYNNTDKFSWAAFLGRFPHVLAMIHATGYGLNPLTKFILKTYLRFMKIDENDSSGVNLSWMFAYGCDLLGISSDRLIELTLLLPKTTRVQFDEDHPIVQYADKAAQILKDPNPLYGQTLAASDSRKESIL